MSKKSKKKPQEAIGVAAVVAEAIASEPDALPSAQFTLAELQASARTHLGNKEWAEILALGRVPLTAIRDG